MWRIVVSVAKTIARPNANNRAAKTSRGPILDSLPISPPEGILFGCPVGSTGANQHSSSDGVAPEAGAGTYAVRASVRFSSFIICWRIMNFWGLPVAVIGYSATNRT